MSVEQVDETPGVADAEPEETAADAGGQSNSGDGGGGDDDRKKAYAARDQAKAEARAAAAEARQLKARLSELERAKAEADGNIAEMLKIERSAWAEQRQEYETQLSELMQEREQRLREDRESQFLSAVAEAAGLTAQDAKLARWALLDAKVDLAPESFDKRNINAAVVALEKHAPQLMKPKKAADAAAPAPGQNLRVKPLDERPASSARERVIANAKALSELSRGSRRRL